MKNRSEKNPRTNFRKTKKRSLLHDVYPHSEKQTVEKRCERGKEKNVNVEREKERKCAVCAES